jgi:hypothetical protein
VVYSGLTQGLFFFFFSWVFEIMIVVTFQSIFCLEIY